MSRLTLFLFLSLCITSVLCASPFDALSTSPIASSIVVNDDASSIAIDDQNNIIQHKNHAQTAITTHQETILATSASMDSEENAFVTLINNYRAANGLGALILSKTITDAAEWMAKDMAEKNYFSHTDSLNRDPFVRMEAFGYPKQGYRGENIAAGNALASATFTQWKNSAGHNANMLNGNFRIMGIARYYVATSRYRWYWVNNFGSVINQADILNPTTTTPTAPPTQATTTRPPTQAATTRPPATAAPSTAAPTTTAPVVTAAPTSTVPATTAPPVTTAAPTTLPPVTTAPPTTAAPTTTAPTSPSGPVMDSEERAFVTLINNYRAANGLGSLILSKTITNAAEWMAKDMADKNYFSHTDSLNRDPFVRMEAFGYPRQGYRGENIAAGNSLASGTFDQWKNSPGHNANMLNANFRIMGIARYYNASSTYRWYWVNNFGSVINQSDVLP